MKVCSKCQIADAREGQAWCAYCQSKYDQAYYRQHRVRRLETNRRFTKTRREERNKLKDGPCTDCGNRFPPVAMQWDHRPGEVKLFNVADNTQRAWQKVLDEIAKCDLVCANCHAIRTHKPG